MRPSRTLLLVFALIGMLLSGYALSLHYDSDGSSICNISEGFDCDKVNKSPWSTFLGIPVALLGLMSYTLFFLLILKRTTIQRKLAFTKKDFWQYVLVLVGVMVAFQMYLTMMEVMYIKAYCIICLLNQLLILILFAYVFVSWKRA